MSEKGKKSKKKTGLGLAIWILMFLIILIVFLVKQEEIKENFDKSGATALIEKKIGKELSDKKQPQKTDDSEETIIDLTKNFKKSEPVERAEPAQKTVPSPKSEEKKPEVALKTVETQNSAPVKSAPAASETNEKAPETAQTQKTESTTAKSQQTQAQKEQTAPAQPTQTKPVVAQKTETPVPSPAPVANTIKAKICFVAIDSDGPVVRKEVTRSVEKDSPMGDALRMLLAGPSATEAKTGCRSLIPEGTRLLGASVKNGIATLNFSEEFQFNQFGAEGSLAQLMQVVYTATNFSTVKGVQILIEGQKRDYLTEGVWIGSPLNRNSF
ncbi:MAG: GerMN domain-containing protein [Treponema sp.]|nr:GerMN domain-containing protein [Treponema sp.]